MYSNVFAKQVLILWNMYPAKLVITVFCVTNKFFKNKVKDETSIFRENHLKKWITCVRYACCPMDVICKSFLQKWYQTESAAVSL